MFRQITPFAVSGALSLALTTPALSQPPQTSSQERSSALEEVIVSAQRRAENVQDVPISITVLSQEQITNSNVVNSADIAAYTPSLQANTRFGPENATFTIRGFTQDLRTTASVATYFAEVVAPRGQSTQTSGDGAGPGSLFDLENLQVLKGPQGTLFGRNTTGGAILLVPNRPSDNFEGYVELTKGNLNSERLQAIVNAPITNAFAMRLGIDKSERDGTLNNIMNVGADSLGNVDYTALRLSTLWNITDTLENYTIFTHVDSESNGYTSQLYACDDPTSRLADPAAYDPQALIDGLPDLIALNINPLNPIPGVNTGSPFAFFTFQGCQDQLENQRQSGQFGFYDIASTVADPITRFEEKRFINTLTWDLTENITVKNILAYAHLHTENSSNIFGNYFPDQTDLEGKRELTVGITIANPDIPVTSQETWVWELQMQGLSDSGRFDWQAGLYYENSQPDGFSGNNAASFLYCEVATIAGDPTQANCFDPLNGLLGGVLNYRVKTEYLNKAVYAQGSYDIFEPLSVTLGLRYTWDETEGVGTKELYRFSGTASQPPQITSQAPSLESTAPTGMLEFTYRPLEDVMTYARYTRGYRQGTVNMAADPGLDTHEPETIDTYELGLKASFDWPIPGRFNIAVFDNTLTDMQLQGGYISTTSGPTTAIFNAGEGESRGVEIEAFFRPFEFLTASLSYSKLDTELVESADFCDRVAAVGILEGFSCTPIADAGNELPFAAESSYVLNLIWTLPVPLEWGLMTLGTTYAYTGEQRVAADSQTPDPYIDEFALFNANIDWSGIFGSNFDLVVFGSNLRNEEYETYKSGTLRTLGFDSRSVGQPKFFGARLRYNF